MKLLNQKTMKNNNKKKNLIREKSKKYLFLLDLSGSIFF